MTALLKLFGNKASDRILERSDFHVPISIKPDELTENDLFIEARFSFDTSLESETASDIPVFLKHLVVDDPQGNPYLRIRLNARWEKSSNPEGVIESNTYYVTSGLENIQELDLVKASRRELDLIKMIYIPAIRQPNE